MSIFAVADLHLSFNINKPMYVFGDNWIGYEEKIKKDWMEKITDNDLVLLPGDFSWETYLENTYKDFEFINNLPGKKILLKVRLNTLLSFWEFGRKQAVWRKGSVLIYYF